MDTYPSQDITPQSTTQLEEMADRLKTVDHEADARRQTTKLYQTTASQTWASVTRTNIMDLTIRTTAATKVTHSYTDQQGNEDVKESLLSDSPHDDDVNVNKDTIVEIGEDGNDDKEDTIENRTRSYNQLEFKRSADFAAVSPAEQLNNYTNFSRSTR